jgi:5-methylcytosine-specific restriction endonuclease McrA
MPMDRSRYPRYWDRISLYVRKRAGWKCEWCGVAQGTVVEGAKRPYKIVLTVAHIGVPYPDGRAGNPHDKMDTRRENLVALCQPCHLRFDREEHLERQRENRKQLQLLRLWIFLRIKFQPDQDSLWTPPLSAV